MSDSPISPHPPGVDWGVVGQHVIEFVAGAAVTVAALWRKFISKAPELPKRPTEPSAQPAQSAETFHDGAALFSAALTALRDSVKAVQESEDASRTLYDSSMDAQVSLASQIGALREVQERLDQTEKKLRRALTKIEDLEKGDS